MNFILIILFLMPSIAGAKEYIKDYDCDSKSHVATQNEWIIFSDPTEANAEAVRLKGKIAGLKGDDGKIVYMVKYENTMVKYDDVCERKAK